MALPLVILPRCLPASGSVLPGTRCPVPGRALRVPRAPLQLSFPQHTCGPSVLPSAAASLSPGLQPHPLNSGSRQPHLGPPSMWPQEVWTEWATSAHRWLPTFADHMAWGPFCSFRWEEGMSRVCPRVQATYLHLERPGSPGRCGTALPPRPRLPGPGRRPPGNAPSSAPRPAHFGHKACMRPRAESPQTVNASVTSANKTCSLRVTTLCHPHTHRAPPQARISQSSQP